jgi:hypothetical protein
MNSVRLLSTALLLCALVGCAPSSWVNRADRQTLRTRLFHLCFYRRATVLRPSRKCPLLGEVCRFGSKNFAPHILGY